MERKEFLAEFLFKAMDGIATAESIMGIGKKLWAMMEEEIENPPSIPAPITEVEDASPVAPPPVITYPEEHAPAAPIVEPEPGISPEEAASDLWDPEVSELQGRYGADKLEIMRGRLRDKGIEAPKSWKGKQIHQKILELVNEVPSAPSVPSEGNEITIEMVRTKLGILADPTGLNQAVRAGQLLKEVGGCDRLTDPATNELIITQEGMNALYSALVSEIAMG